MRPAEDDQSATELPSPDGMPPRDNDDRPNQEPSREAIPGLENNRERPTAPQNDDAPALEPPPADRPAATPREKAPDATNGGNDLVPEGTSLQEDAKQQQGEAGDGKSDERKDQRQDEPPAEKPGESTEENIFDESSRTRRRSERFAILLNRAVAPRGEAVKLVAGTTELVASPLGADACQDPDGRRGTSQDRPAVQQRGLRGAAPAAPGGNPLRPARPVQ